jgi:hypothetical protein
VYMALQAVDGPKITGSETCGCDMGSTWCNSEGECHSFPDICYSREVVYHYRDTTYSSQAVFRIPGSRKDLAAWSGDRVVQELIVDYEGPCD